MNSAMVDLETMGVGPNAAVVQVGCRLFDIGTGELGEGMLVDVDVASAVSLGGKVDASTTKWWLDRGGFHPVAIPVPMEQALDQLRAFLSSTSLLNPPTIWSQGANFDIPILEGYYERAGQEAPWMFYMARDTRTVYDLARQVGWSKNKNRPETQHQALADCDEQIGDLVAALQAIRGGGAEPKISTAQKNFLESLLRRKSFNLRTIDFNYRSLKVDDKHQGCSVDVWMGGLSRREASALIEQLNQA